MSAMTDLVWKALDGIGYSRESCGSNIDTSLIGEGGLLDSLELVTLLIDLEIIVDEQLGVSICLSDAKAFSPRNSPFSTVARLAAFVDELVTRQAA